MTSIHKKINTRQHNNSVDLMHIKIQGFITRISYNPKCSRIFFLQIQNLYLHKCPFILHLSLIKKDFKDMSNTTYPPG